MPVFRRAATGLGPAGAELGLILIHFMKARGSKFCGWWVQRTVLSIIMQWPGNRWRVCMFDLVSFVPVCLYRHALCGHASAGMAAPARFAPARLHRILPAPPDFVSVRFVLWYSCLCEGVSRLGEKKQGGLMVASIIHIREKRRADDRRSDRPNDRTDERTCVWFRFFFNARVEQTGPTPVLGSPRASGLSQIVQCG